MSASNLQAVLSGASAITEMVGNRINIAPTKQGVKTPHISYELESTDPIKDLNGIANLKREDWIVFVLDNNFLSCDAIRQKVIEVITQERARFTATLQGSDYEFDNDAKTHLFEITFTLAYY